MVRTSAQDIKDRVDLRDVVVELWGAPRYQSRNYDKHHAQWRDDGTHPSFVVYHDRFKDYGGDGESGDVFAFIQHELNLDFKEAMDWLRRYAGMPVEQAHSNRRKRQNPSAPLTTKPVKDTAPDPQWQSAALTALRESQAYLWSDKEDAKLALNYLMNVRGLHPETIREFEFGYNPQWRKVDWVNPETGKNAYLAPGIVIPWWQGKTLIALRIRCRVGNFSEAMNIQPDTNRAGDELPKYLSLAGSRQNHALYNSFTLKAGCHVVIVEGEFDAALADEILSYRVSVMNPPPEDPPVVITLGSASNRLDEAQIEKLNQAAEITLMLDNDEAGLEAQREIIKQLNHRNIRIAYLDGFKDVTDFVMDFDDGGNLLEVMEDTRSLAWWVDGVPDSIRTALLTYFRDATAPVIEMLNTAVLRNLIHPDHFTVKDILSASETLGYKLTKNTVRNVIDDLFGYFFQKCNTKNNSLIVSPFWKNDVYGRKATYYSLLPLEQIHESILAWAMPRIYEKHHPVDEENGIVAIPTAAMLKSMGFQSDWAADLADKLHKAYRRAYCEQENIEEAMQQTALRALNRLRNDLRDEYSTPLPEDWMISNGASYRAAYLRALHNPDERLSRREIARLLGVNVSRVDKFVEQAGLARSKAQGEFEVTELRSTRDISGQIKQGARQVKGYPRSLISVSDDGEVTESSYRGDESVAFIASEMGKGNKIRVKYQVANHFVAVTEGQPEIVTEKASTEEKPKPKCPASRRRDAKSPFDSVKRYYGASYNPDWLRLQLLLALVRIGRVDYRVTDREPLLLDMVTGEVYVDANAVDLLRLLLPDEPIPDDPAQVLGIVGQMVLG